MGREGGIGLDGGGADDSEGVFEGAEEAEEPEEAGGEGIERRWRSIFKCGF